jgi:hypothetical protein
MKENKSINLANLTKNGTDKVESEDDITESGKLTNNNIDASNIPEGNKKTRARKNQKPKVNKKKQEN